MQSARNTSTPDETRTGSPRCLIGAVITISHDAPGFAPSGNYIGTVIMGRFLTAALREAGLLADPLQMPLYGGALNDSIFVFAVVNRDTALRCLHETLSMIHFHTVCRIGWLDADEEIWRQVVPKDDGHPPLNECLSVQAILRLMAAAPHSQSDAPPPQSPPAT